jgi:Uncharacterized protein conserved in bacteria (DUF2147)
MKMLLAAAALLLASTAAQAQYTFEYGGRTIRVDPDRGTVHVPGVYDNTKKSKAKDDAPAKKKQDSATTTTAAPPPAATPAPATEAAPPAAVAAPAPGVAPSIQVPMPPALGAVQPTTTTAAAPSDAAVPATVAPPPPPPVQQTVAPPPPGTQQSIAPPPPAPAPAPTVAVAPPPAQPAPPPARPAVASNSPIGVWLTEEKEGKVRIEQCGANLCGYSVDKKTNQNGEQVLINMRPGKDKWSGRILDPGTGSTYDSTIAMKGTETLRVQGCAFGGVFCGGQTWTRVN